MKPTNFIHAARAKKQAEVIRSLEQTFTDFAYPVYLFGSFATGNFHGYSDIDLVILVTKQQAKQAYNEACDKLAGLKTPYDILTCQSMDELDNTIQSTLHPLNTPPQMANTRKYQQGMSLIEIMIALLIGAFLLGGVIQIFVNSKQTYRMQEGLSRLQENGRFALDFLAKDIRMAGFIGCNSDPSLITTTCTEAGIPAGCKMPNTLEFTPAGYLYNFATAIQGFESTSAIDITPTTWSPDLPTVTTATGAEIPLALGGSDIITIRRADDQSFTVTAHASPTADLTLNAPAGNCTIAVVSDCSAAAVFQVSAITGNDHSHNTGGGCTPGNASNDLGKTYVGAQVYPINTISYYVRANPSGQPSLYRRIGSNDAEELVEGIEQMQISYGVDTDFASPPTTLGYGVPNYYVSANTVAVADWPKVVSVRISLLARTIDDNLAAQPLAYNYPLPTSAATTPTDRRIRRVFNSTIAIRNRLP